MSKHNPPFRTVCPTCGAWFDEAPEPETGLWYLGFNCSDATACKDKPIERCPEWLAAVREYREEQI